MNVTILPQALEEIANIHEYISHTLANPSAANNLVSQIYDKTSLLATFPFSGTAILDEPAASMGLRKLLVKNYVVIYEVHEKTEEVNILHVYYAKSDYISYL